MSIGRWIYYALLVFLGAYAGSYVEEHFRIMKLKMTPIENYIVLNAEIAIRDSKIEDLCTAIDMDTDNFRTSCKDIMDANDRGEGRTP